jgi:hypothetical protein
MRTSAKRIADFMYSKRDDDDLAGSSEEALDPSTSSAEADLESRGQPDSLSVLPK